MTHPTHLQPGTPATATHGLLDHLAEALQRRRRTGRRADLAVDPASADRSTAVSAVSAVSNAADEAVVTGEPSLTTVDGWLSSRSGSGAAPAPAVGPPVRVPAWPAWVGSGPPTAMSAMSAQPTSAVAVATASTAGSTAPPASTVTVPPPASAPTPPPASAPTQPPASALLTATARSTTPHDATPTRRAIAAAPAVELTRLDAATEPTAAPTSRTAPAGPRDRIAVDVPAGTGAALLLTDGRRVALTATLLVGRNPAPRAGETVGALVVVEDPARSVSKTHLLVGRDDQGAWVVDRASTNGTVVTLPDGQRILCVPERRVRLVAGAVVHFGDHGFALAGTPTGPDSH